MQKAIKNYYRISLVLTFAGLLASCATPNNPAAYYPEAPISENFEPSYQKKLNASAHWEVIAGDLSTQLLSTLTKSGLQEKPVYINLYSEKTPFSRAFHDFLTTHLVKKGVLVSKDKINSTIYNYKIQPVKFESGMTTSLASNFKWTALATGLIVIRDIADSLHLNKDIVTAGVAADAWSTGGTSRLELIITTSILNRDVYIHRSSDVYYANSDDLHLYEQQTKASKKNVFDDPFYNIN